MLSLLRTKSVARSIIRSLTTSSESLSIIEKAKQFGATSLVGPYPHRGGFDSCLQGMVIERMDEIAVASLPVIPLLGNSWGTLHGGAVATLIGLVDTFSSHLIA
jgi:hypothetical protein